MSEGEQAGRGGGRDPECDQVQKATSGQDPQSQGAIPLGCAERNRRLPQVILPRGVGEFSWYEVAFISVGGLAYLFSSTPACL